MTRSDKKYSPGQMSRARLFAHRKRDDRSAGDVSRVSVPEFVCAPAAAQCAA